MMMIQTVMIWLMIIIVKDRYDNANQGMDFKDNADEDNDNIADSRETLYA